MKQRRSDCCAQHRCEGPNLPLKRSARKVFIIAVSAHRSSLSIENINGYVRAPTCHVRTELAIWVAYEPRRPPDRTPPCGALTFAQQIIALHDLGLASLDRVPSS